MKDAGQFFQEFAYEFDTLYDGKRNAIMRWFDWRFRSDMFRRFEMTFELLGDLGGKTVFDIGCGSGPYIVEALKRGATSVTGIDPASNMLLLAKDRAARIGLADRTRFVEGYFPDQAPEETFDCAIAMGVTDYVRDATRFVRELHGTISCAAVVSFPSRHWLRSPLRRIRYQLRNCPLFLYTKGEIEKTLHEAGVANYRIFKIQGAGMDFVVWIAR